VGERFNAGVAISTDVLDAELAVLQAGHDALAAKMGAMKEDQLVAKVENDRLTASLQEFLQKQGGLAQYRGSASETVVEEQLTRLYPTASVQRTTAVAGAGDFKLDRGPAFPVVMVENKNYVENVRHSEVQKFLRDATAQRCSAVLLSQKSGIVGKRDFEIRANALVRGGGLSGGPEHRDAVLIPTELDQGDPEVTLDRGVTRSGCQCPAQHDLGVVQKVVAKPGDALIKLFLNGVFEFGCHAAQPRSAGLTGPAQMR
jgi:hypothetical protein